VRRYRRVGEGLVGFGSARRRLLGPLLLGPEALTDVLADPGLVDSVHEVVEDSGDVVVFDMRPVMG
jgi:hypothetical protein